MKKVLTLLLLFLILACSNEKAIEYFDKGVAKVNLEDNQGAIQDFNKAIEL